MKLDMDCVRDILLCVEENTGLRKNCVFIDGGLSETADFLGNRRDPEPYQQELLDRYDNDTLIYHVYYCIEAGLISKLSQSSKIDIYIADLTPAGHELIGNIRADTNWKKVQETGSKIGAFGLNMVSKIAEAVATAWLKQYLGLP